VAETKSISSEIKIADTSTTTTAKVPESVVEVPKENKTELDKEDKKPIQIAVESEKTELKLEDPAKDIKIEVHKTEPPKDELKPHIPTRPKGRTESMDKSTPKFEETTKLEHKPAIPIIIDAVESKGEHKKDEQKKEEHPLIPPRPRGQSTIKKNRRNP